MSSRGSRGGPPRGGGGGDRGRGRGQSQDHPFRDSSRGRGGGGGDRGDRGGGRGEFRGGRGDRGGGRGDFRGGRGDRGGGRGDFRGGRGDFRGARGDFRGGRGRGGGRTPARVYEAEGGAPPVSQAVTNLEDKIANNIIEAKQKPSGGTKKVAASKQKSDKPEPGDKTIEFPERPGYGTVGEQIKLYTNYMELACNWGNQALYRYEVSVTDARGQEEKSKKKKQIIRLLLEQHFGPQKLDIASDFKSTLISREALTTVENEELKEIDSTGTLFPVRYKAEEDDEYRDNPLVYAVTVKYTGSLFLKELVDYIGSSVATEYLKEKAELIQALNIIVGHNPKSRLDVATVGGNKHFSLLPSSEEFFNLGGGLQVVRGFLTSVRAATSRLLINVQVKNIACYQAGELSRVIESTHMSGRNLERFLKTIRIQLNHLQSRSSSGRASKPRVKSVNGFAMPQDGPNLENPPRVKGYAAGPYDVEFWREGKEPAKAPSGDSKSKKGKKKPTDGPPTAGAYISVAKYFKEVYGLDVDRKWPVINVGSRQNPSYVPVDVCAVTAGQPANKKLTPDQTASMIKFAVRSPGENAESIVKQGTQLLGFGPRPNDTLARFGLLPNSSLITVTGHILKAPSISYKTAKGDGSNVIPKGASWNMINIKFHNSKSLGRWSYLVVDAAVCQRFWNSPSALAQSIRDFTSKLKEVGITNVEMPTAPQSLYFEGQRFDETTLRECLSSLATKNLNFLLVILPRRDTEIYNAIKFNCDVRFGIRHACVVAEKFAKDNNHQYNANEALKINLKLGGTNQLLGNNQLGIIDEGNTMLVGIDVTHPSPGSVDRAPSIAAMVASVDKFLGQFPAELRVQRGKQEKVDALDSLLASRLTLWRNNNGKLPNNIIVYRDGVSEGQYEMVVTEELPQLRKACDKMYTTALKPRISVVIVGKRHNTRFYVTNPDQADEKSKNPPNGTVVDRGITEARNFDFFLQSHKALQGTARPAHYFTVYDEIFHAQNPKYPCRNTADVLHDLTHRLCYTFGRATKAVSICPPAYYADLVCERARCYLSDIFDAPTPAASEAPGPASSDAGSAPLPGADRVVIHPNIKNTMFYI
ncbi:ribonuclease H-like domain-containing protein [Talaromyces proteolyticus]|uniref:Ribonuclease H-like domain-containing protein n=1 Tax=Talaromyces proteolyticus TaxID=1131652 RepID=A0AAD4PWP8_9EURO|nr:ribonuclease H-like domain-containing protein [Talaromyces proteolyticus]KAH8692202.1 ribonuclease H-like domain-containing protein [Talaromyces proteolyticus]